MPESGTFWPGLIVVPMGALLLSDGARLTSEKVWSPMDSINESLAAANAPRNGSFRNSPAPTGLFRFRINCTWLGVEVRESNHFSALLSPTQKSRGLPLKVRFR